MYQGYNIQKTIFFMLRTNGASAVNMLAEAIFPFLAEISKCHNFFSTLSTPTQQTMDALFRFVQFLCNPFSLSQDIQKVFGSLLFQCGG